MRTQTPKWLRDATFQFWFLQNNIVTNFTIGWFCIAILLITISFVISCATPRKEGVFLFVGALIVALIMCLIVTILFFLLRNKYGNQKEWQQKYLRSKIKEAVDYESRMEKVITVIQEDAADEVKQIKENLKAMLEKKTQAEEWLPKLG